jgi:hypothetical protein
MSKPKSKVLWRRNDGVTRIVLAYHGDEYENAELVVEGRTRDAMGRAGWSYVSDAITREGHLESFALALLGVEGRIYRGELVTVGQRSR